MCSKVGGREAENNQIADMNLPPTAAFGEEDRNFGVTREKIWEGQVKNAILAELPFAPPNVKKAWSSLMETDMEKEIRAYHQQEKEKLVAQFGNLTSRVSFSIEIMKETGWISISAHFIDDDFNLEKRLIGFKKLPDYSSGLCEADIIESCISDWQLEDKIFSFATDLDSALMKRLRGKFHSKMYGNREKFITLCIRKPIENSLAMYLHDLYVENMKIVEDVIESPIRRLKFNKIAEEMELPPINEDWSKGQLPMSLYAGTKGWKFCCSVVKIFKEVLLYKQVFREPSFAEISQPSFTHLRSIRWTELEEAVNYFEKINPIIDLFSNSKDPTSNLYFPSFETINGICEYTFDDDMFDLDLHSMYIFCAACVLDPRFKLTYFEYLHSKEGSGFPLVTAHDIGEFFDSLFCIYAKEKTNQACSLSIGTANTQDGCPSSSSTNQGLSRIIGTYPLKLKESRATKGEMIRYLGEETVDVEDTNFNLLGWWKQNRPRYPVLSKMARDLLAAPACIYSVNESLIRDLSVLDGVSPELAEDMICLKDWILSGV